MKKSFGFLPFLTFFVFSCSTSKESFEDLENNITFSATPSAIYIGDNSTLNWAIPEDLENVQIKISEFQENLSNSGSKIVSPSSTKNYVLNIERKGKIISKTTNVEVFEKPTIEFFNVNSNSINYGESIELTWSVKNVSRERINIDKQLNVGSKGSLTIKLFKDSTFNLKVFGFNDKLIAEKQLNVKVSDELPSKDFSGAYKFNIKTNDSKVSFSEGPDDGRFSLGGNGKRLMYGWPIPQSTSHFVLKVNSNYGTNYKRLSGGNVYYISSKQFTKGEKGSFYHEITYMLDGVKLVQRLIPVDKNFKPVKINSFGQYYKIEYEIINTTKEDKQVGLISLTDLMLDNNDAPTVEVNGKKLSSSTKYSKNEIPDQLLVLKASGNKTDHAGKFVLNEGSVKADFLHYGRWSYFNSVIWDVNIEGVDISDNAIIQKWGDEKLKPNDKKTCSYHYGLLNDAQISMVSTDNNLKQTGFTVYFESGSTNITAESKKLLDKELAQISGNIKGFLVAGFADAQGPFNNNIKLSERRISELTKYFGKKGISKEYVIPKAYGESASDQSKKSQKKGNDLDRKCEIIIFSTSN
jgi:outer membrane protein OmpA-like peptidoglycan-associated protein